MYHLQLILENEYGGMSETLNMLYAITHNATYLRYSTCTVISRCMFCV